VTRTLLVPASYVALLRGDPDAREVLLLLRQGTGFRDGHWATIAGHVGESETAAAAAAREAHEECGVQIAEVDLQPLTTVHRIIPGAGQVEQRVDFFWTAENWTGLPRIAEPDRTADLQWFPLSALPEPIVPHELEVLTRLASGGVVPAILLA
jgi:8-oxo-dGTP diphosphatase